MPFAPGKSGNPAGRPPGRSPTAKLRRIIEQEAPAIIAALIQRAKEGDTQAAVALISRVLPPIRAIEAPAHALPMASLEDAPEAVLAALSAGTLTAEQASTLASTLTALAKVRESTELESRITRLEESIHAYTPDNPPGQS
jgi:hypothetical protein